MSTSEELRQEIITAIEDVFVRTLRVDLDEDVPQLADNIMSIIAANFAVSE